MKRSRNESIRNHIVSTKPSKENKAQSWAFFVFNRLLRSRLMEKHIGFTKADVSVKTALGISSRVVAVIFDKQRGWEYTLSVADFDRFLETGGFVPVA